MTVIITASILCLINVILWIILAIRFKKIFSTEEIIEKTRDELNKMLGDVNRNAERNITLIEEKIKQLKAVSAEADRRLAVVKSELEKNGKNLEIQNKILTNSKTQSSRSGSGNLSAAEKYRREQALGDLFSSSENKNEGIENESGLNSKNSNKIPLITPQIYMTDKPVEPKKDFNTLVKEKSQQGLTVEEIAAELGRSISEVKFSLEF